ncbi:MAG: hypothetical protein H6619_03055 [Deltaproteobacteria bacterium]|nr:hypothetical protein [Deltaproteobacteria bacterium]
MKTSVQFIYLFLFFTSNLISNVSHAEVAVLWECNATADITYYKYDSKTEETTLLGTLTYSDTYYTCQSSKRTAESMDIFTDECELGVYGDENGYEEASYNLVERGTFTSDCIKIGGPQDCQDENMFRSEIHELR